VVSITKDKDLEHIHVQWCDVKLALWPFYIAAHSTQVDGGNALSTEVLVLELGVKPAWNFVFADKPVIFASQLQYRHVRLEIETVSNEVGQQSLNSSGILRETRGRIDTGDEDAVIEVVNTRDMNVDATNS